MVPVNKFIKINFQKIVALLFHYFSLALFVNEKELCRFSVLWCNVHGVTNLHVTIHVILGTRGFSCSVMKKTSNTHGNNVANSSLPKFPNTLIILVQTQALSDRFVLSHC